MSTLHHACWLLLAAGLAWYALRPWRNPVELLAPPLLVAFGFVNVCIVQYVKEPDWAIRRFLDPDHYAAYLGLAVLSLAAFALGFEGARRLPLRAAAPAREWPSGLVQACALGFAFVGAAAQAAFIAMSGGFMAFYSAPHGTAGAWEQASAYLYTLPQLLFPALYLLLANRVRQGRQNLLVLAVALALLGFLVFQAVVFGNRGDTMRLALMLGAVVLFFGRPSRTTLVKIGLLFAAAAAAMSILPYLRDAVHFGAETSLAEALAKAQELDANLAGQEIFFGPAVVGIAAQRGIMDLGFAWLYPFVSFVPRALWPGKPYGGEWSINYAALIEAYTDWELFAGSAPTGLADAFLRFSWLSPLAWLLLGAAGGRIWRRAVERTSVASVGFLFAFQGALVYVVMLDWAIALLQWLPLVLPLWALSAATALGGRLLGPPRTPGLQPSEVTRDDPRTLWPAQASWPSRGRLASFRPLSLRAAQGGGPAARPAWPRDLDRRQGERVGAGGGGGWLRPAHAAHRA